MLPRLDVPSAFLALLLCFSAALPAVAQEPTPAAGHRRSGCPRLPADQAPICRRPKPTSAITRCRSSASRSTRPDFKHFDWVNPDAPKGGTLRGFAEGSFDSLNPFSVKGDPGRRHRP